MTGLSCESSICPADYYENVFKDCTYDCPWFKHGNACVKAENVPAGTERIHRSKDSCCRFEFQNDVAGCDERQGGFLQLRYNARFTMTGLDCSSSSADKANAAKDIAKSIIGSICNKVRGLQCDPGDKVQVTKFCNQNVDHYVDYHTASHRMLSDSNIVEYTIILSAIAESDIRRKDTLLGQYLQGSSLNTILADILNEIGNSSTQSLHSISNIYFEFINSFIQGLGLYYPAWGSLETCLNDGNQPGETSFYFVARVRCPSNVSDILSLLFEDYMNVQPDLWLLATLDSCCKQYYSWDTVGCHQQNANANLISGSGSASIVDPTADLYYPDWGGTNTCE